MSKSFVAAGAVVVLAGAGVALFLQQQTNDVLHGEIALLRDEVRQLAERDQARRTEARGIAVADTVDHLQRESDRAEVARLREELDALKKRAQEFGRVAQAVGGGGMASSDAAAVKLIPMSGWKNAGRGSPEATAETVLWAAVGGEIETLADSIVFTPSAREKAEALLARMSDTARAQYSRPEKLVALMLAKDAAAVTSMAVLGQREIATGDVGMRVRFGGEQGKTKDETFLMRRGADGWRMMVPDGPVEKYERQLLGPGK